MADSNWRHALVNGDSHRKETSPGERYSAVRCPSALPIDLLKIDDLVKPPPINLASGLDARISESRARPADCYIDRLPPELLCAVFLMCGHTDEEFNYPRENMFQAYRRRARSPQLLYSRAAVSLGYVCARWFAVTRGFPRLWTMVDVGSPEPCDTPILKRCIRYSNGLPLTMRLHERPYARPYTRALIVQACRNFMRSVASVASRWQEISILSMNESLALEELLEPLLSVSADAYSRLQRAIMWRWDAGTHGPVSVRLWEMFFASPSIRTAQWFAVSLRVPSHALSKLTHIGANHIPPEKILDLLRSCPQVEVFQVTPNRTIQGNYLCTDVIPALPAPIILPRLRRLMLSHMPIWTNFFDGITAPSLDRLDIAYSGVQASAIECMLIRSHARLSMLALRYLYKGTTDGCVALLRSSPLRHLRILFCEVPSNEGEGSIEDFDYAPTLPPQCGLITNDFEYAEHTYALLS